MAQDDGSRFEEAFAQMLRAHQEELLRCNLRCVAEVAAPPPVFGTSQLEFADLAGAEAFLGLIQRERPLSCEDICLFYELLCGRPGLYVSGPGGFMRVAPEEAGKAEAFALVGDQAGEILSRLPQSATDVFIFSEIRGVIDASRLPKLRRFVCTSKEAQCVVFASAKLAKSVQVDMREECRIEGEKVVI